MAILSSPPSKWKVNGEILAPRKTGLALEVQEAALIYDGFLHGYGGTIGEWAVFSNKDLIGPFESGFAQDKSGAYTLINKKNTGSGYIAFRVGNDNKVQILNDGTLKIMSSMPVIEFATTLAVASSTANHLYRATVDSRLHIKDNSSVDHVVAYVDEITGSSGITVANYITNETPTGTVNGINDTFITLNTPESGTVQVYENGLLQSLTDDYTIVSDTITFVNPPLTGAKIRVSYVKA